VGGFERALVMSCSPAEGSGGAEYSVRSPRYLFSAGLRPAGNKQSSKSWTPVQGAVGGFGRALVPSGFPDAGHTARISQRGRVLELGCWFGLYTTLPLPILCVVYIAITGCRWETLCCAILWAMPGWGGVPKQRVGAQRMVLISSQTPRNKTQTNFLYGPSSTEVGDAHLGLYTTLTSPIVYSVWHTGGGGRWGGVYCAMVVQ